MRNQLKQYVNFLSILIYQLNKLGNLNIPPKIELERFC